MSNLYVYINIYLIMSTMLRKRIFSIKRRAMLKTIRNMSSQHVKSEDMLRI